MSLDCFNYLHKTLEPALREEFEVGERARGGTPNGNISTKLRLSAALRFFAGGSVYDIMLTHGMSKSSVYKSVYGVVNVVNHEPSLSFNENGAKFPSHDEQKVLAKGFLAKSGADFDKIVMAIDGMLIWTIQPSRADCDKLKIGERMFHCYRKDKFKWQIYVILQELLIMWHGCPPKLVENWKLMIVILYYLIILLLGIMLLWRT